jgi:hypothetical protein
VNKAKSQRQRQSKKTPIVNEISDDSEPELETSTRRAEIRRGKKKAVTGHNSNPGPSATSDRESDKENGHYDDIDGAVL